MYSKENILIGYKIRRIVTTLLLLVISGMLLLIRNPFQEKWNTIFSYIWFILSPGICFILLEYLNKEVFEISITAISLRYIVLNLIIYVIILFFFYVITGSPKQSVICLTVITTVFGLMNYYVCDFRGLAIMASDIYSAETAGSVAQNYKLFMDFNIFTTIILAGFVILLTLKLKPKRLLKWRGRIVITLAFGLTFYSFWNV